LLDQRFADGEIEPEKLTKEEAADQNPVVLGTTPRIIDDREIELTKRAEQGAVGLVFRSWS